MKRPKQINLTLSPQASSALYEIIHTTQHYNIKDLVEDLVAAQLLIIRQAGLRPDPYPLITATPTTKGPNK